MGYPLRLFVASELYHVTARGNNKQPIFGDDIDRREYLQVLLETTQKYAVKTHAFALMPNHIHLLLQPTQSQGISETMHRLNVTYTKYMNRRYERVGHLFQGRFHSSHVDKETYLLVASRYIHNNPVRAGLVKEAIDYLWSSVRAFTGESAPNSSLDKLIEKLVDTSLTLSLFGREGAQRQVAYREFLKSVSDTYQVCI